MDFLIKFGGFLKTYQSLLIGDIVGQFKLVKRNSFIHPLFACGWTVGVDVHPFGHLRIGLASHHPLAVVKLVSKVVGGHNVQQQDVLGLLIQAGEFKLHLWKNLSKNRKISINFYVIDKLDK